jgi:hypothetical protein
MVNCYRTDNGLIEFLLEARATIRYMGLGLMISYSATNVERT